MSSRRKKRNPFRFLRRKTSTSSSNRSIDSFNSNASTKRRGLFRRKMSPIASSYLAVQDPTVSDTSILSDLDEDGSTIDAEFGGASPPSSVILKVMDTVHQGEPVIEVTMEQQPLNLTVIPEEQIMDDCSSSSVNDQYYPPQEYLQMVVTPSNHHAQSGKNAMVVTTVSFPVTPNHASRNPAKAVISPSPDRIAPPVDEGVTLTPIRTRTDLDYDDDDPEQETEDTLTATDDVINPFFVETMEHHASSFPTLSPRTPENVGPSGAAAADEEYLHNHQSSPSSSSSSSLHTIPPSLIQENVSLKLAGMSQFDPWNGMCA